MTKPAVTSGTFSDFKLIRGRKVAQLVIEIPLEQADAALTALGGLPNPVSERWVAVARMIGAVPDEPQEPAQIEPPRRKLSDMPLSQQAALRCADPQFHAFLAEITPKHWKSAGNGSEDSAAQAAEVVRLVCDIDSRSQLNKDERAAGRWKCLDDQFFKHKAGMR